MKSKLKTFSLILLILVILVFTKGYTFKKVVDAHIDYVLVHELDNNLIYENKPILNEEKFKKDVTEKIERFFVVRHVKLEKVNYLIENLSIIVEVHYFFYNFPNILLKEVGVYEKP